MRVPKCAYRRVTHRRLPYSYIFNSIYIITCLESRLAVRFLISDGRSIDRWCDMFHFMHRDTFADQHYSATYNTQHSTCFNFNLNFNFNPNSRTFSSVLFFVCVFCLLRCLSVFHMCSLVCCCEPAALAEIVSAHVRILK